MSTQQRQERPEHTRSKSGFSFRSHRSSGSGDKIKLDLTETEKERRKQKFSEKSFANPNRAVQEAEPAVQAQGDRTLSSLSALNGIKDWQGKPILDADASNPTRSRLERPLDTIRSFEAAVDGSYAKRVQTHPGRTGSSNGHFANFDSDMSRRGSVVGGSTVGTDININPRSTAALPGPSYAPRRQQSYQHDMHDQYRGPPSSFPRRNMGPRMNTAPPMMGRPYGQQPQSYNGQSGYGHDGSNSYNGYSGYNSSSPYHSHNESYDIGDSSGSASDRWGTSTDPSSENSSVDRFHAPKQSLEGTGDAYGGAYNGPSSSPYGNNSPMRQSQPIAEESWHEGRGYEGAYNYQGAPHRSGMPYQQNPATPTRDPGLRRPPSFSQMQQAAQGQQQQQPQQQRPFQQRQAPQQSQSYPQQTQQSSRRDELPLGGQMRKPVGPPGQTQPLTQSRSQPQGRGQAPRPRTLEKRISDKPEKRKSWLKRLF